MSNIFKSYKKKSSENRKNESSEKRINESSEKRMNKSQSMPKMKTLKNKIFNDDDDYYNNDNSKFQSMPKIKTLRNRLFNENNNNSFFKYNNFNDNIKFYEIIKNKYTIEDYYHKKYDLQYFTDEDINYFTNIRNEIYFNNRKNKR